MISADSRADSPCTSEPSFAIIDVRFVREACRTPIGEALGLDPYAVTLEGALNLALQQDGEPEGSEVRLFTSLELVVKQRGSDRLAPAPIGIDVFTRRRPLAEVLTAALTACEVSSTPTCAAGLLSPLPREVTVLVGHVEPRESPSFSSSSPSFPAAAASWVSTAAAYAVASDTRTQANSAALGSLLQQLMSEITLVRQEMKAQSAWCLSQLEEREARRRQQINEEKHLLRDQMTLERKRMAYEMLKVRRELLHLSCENAALRKEVAAVKKGATFPDKIVAASAFKVMRGFAFPSQYIGAADDYTALLLHATEHYRPPLTPKHVSSLVACGADVDARTRDETPLLLLAAEKGHTDVVKALLEAGADKESTDNRGRSSLNAAARNGHANVVKALLEAGADKKSKGNDGSSALKAAAFKGHANVVKALLEASE